MKHILSVLKQFTISFLIFSTVVTNTSFLTYDSSVHVIPLGGEFYTDITELN